MSEDLNRAEKDEIDKIVVAESPAGVKEEDGKIKDQVIVQAPLPIEQSPQSEAPIDGEIQIQI